MYTPTILAARARFHSHDHQLKIDELHPRKNCMQHKTRQDYEA